MSSSGMNMCMKTSVPLTYYITDYALLQATRQTQHALLQFINIINFHLVAPLLLHFFQNSVVKRVHIWTVWGPRVR